MPRYFLICSFLCNFVFMLSAQAQEIPLGKISVRKDALESPTLSHDILFEADATYLPYSSLEEVADYSSSVELKKRSANGIQQDISIRGTVFEDNDVSIGGIKLNDPQTGHFSLEIPLTAADIESIRVTKNLHEIDYILKAPAREGGLIRSYFGEHALLEELVSINFPLANISNRISAEYKTSSGARQDTDFEIATLSFNSLWRQEEAELGFLFGMSDRDFGADSFYSSSFRHEEEHTNQRLFILRGALEKESFKNTASIYFRRHEDKFILNRFDPAFYTNYHTTYVTGVQNELYFSNDVFLNLEAREDKITSTNLGNHERLGSGLTLGLRDKEYKDFIVNTAFGLTYYDDWGSLEDVHLGLGRYLSEKLKIRAAYDRLLRLPSFTELYYLSPANTGNSSLEVQINNNFEAGFDYSVNEQTNISASYYLRDQEDTIDWVRNSSSAPWQAQNIGNVNASGIEINASIDIDKNIIRKIEAGYSFLDMDKTNPYNFSKYVFDYNKHKITASCLLAVKDIDIGLIANYNHPNIRDDYFTLDFKVEKKIKQIKIIIQGTNLSNESYEELAGIEADGRWLKAGLEYKF